MPWLLCLVQSTWERQLRIRQFVSKHSHESYHVVLTKDDVNWQFSDTKDFLYRGLLNPIFNYWLYSLLLENVFPEKWTVSYIALNSLKAKQSGLKNSLQERSHNWKKRFSSALFSRLCCNGVYGIGPLWSTYFHFILTAKTHLAPNKHKRQYSQNKYSKTDLTWSLDFNMLLERTLPRCFYNIRELDLSNRKYYPGRCHVIGPKLWYQESEKLRYALLAENGECLIGSQHGGNYGTLKSIPAIAEIEYRQTSAFLSWGWRTQETYFVNAHDISSAYLSRMKRSLFRNSCLILVGTEATPFSFRLDSIPQANQQLDYRKKKRGFIRALRPDIFAKTMYRPYPSSAGTFSDATYVKRHFPNISILKGQLENHLLKAKLAVVDHPVSTLLVLMAANVPTIGFWNHNAWGMCEQAAPYFSHLTKAGIAFSSCEEAAEKVNEIWDNVETWWRQSDVQNARKEFCYHYARTSRFWWWEWSKTLWRL